MKSSMKSEYLPGPSRIHKRAIAYALLVFLPACGIPHHRAPEPGPDTPESYSAGLEETESQDSSANISVEEFFDDPVLTSLIDQALVGNQELRILNEDIQIANNEVLSLRGTYLPMASLGAGASLDKPGEFTRGGAVDSQLEIRPGQAIPTPLPNYLAAANISWQIDIWRMLRNARDAATLRYLGTIDGRNYVVTRLIAELAESYYTLMALDKRLENLDRTIALQEQSLEIAEALKDAARGTELAVQRFRAEVQKNQSERLIVKQEIVVVENRINFLLGRFPETVQRNSDQFFELNLQTLSLGVPSQLLQNRPDIRQAERELEAAGLDVRVARARFYPAVVISAGIGYEAFDPRYLFNTPESLAYNVAGSLVAPLINKNAIRADYLTANSRQIQAVYNYQRVVLNAFTEVVNRVSMVENYRQSIEIKLQQLQSLEASVEVASGLFQNARAEYMDVLFAQRDLMEARMSLIETKKEQLSAVVNAYQALGGGWREYDALMQLGGGANCDLPAHVMPAIEIPEATLIPIQQTESTAAEATEQVTPSEPTTELTDPSSATPAPIIPEEQGASNPPQLPPVN